MSRANYSDGLENWSLIRWRGAVTSATRGHRGQKLFSELLNALDAMPDKALIAEELEHDGRCCALGVVGKARGIAMDAIDPHDSETVAATFNIAEALAREIVYENDEGGYGYWNEPETPEQRWKRVRAWVAKQIVAEPDTKAA